MLRSFRVLFVYVLLALLAACQPIQPIQPAPAAAEPAADLGAEQTITFPTAGLTVAVPAGWLAWYEPKDSAAMVLTSTDVPEDAMRPLTFWGYLSDGPYAILSFRNEGYTESARLAPPENLLFHFRSAAGSTFQINPKGEVTVVEPPESRTVGDRVITHAVIAATDVDFDRAFRAHVWMIWSGDHAIFVSCPLFEENEAAFASVCAQIAESVQVGKVDVAAAEQPLVETGVIEPGQAKTGTLARGLDGKVVRHYWRFAGRGGQEYHVQLDPMAAVDVAGGVVDAAGAIAEPEFDAEGSFGRESFRFVLPADGDYYVVVRAFYNAEGPYSVMLEEK